MSSALHQYLNQVIFGDALQVLKDFPDKSIDLIVTDPPYGDNTVYGRQRTRIAGDENPLLALQVMSEAYRVLKQNAVAYVFFGIRHWSLLQMFFINYTKYKIRDVIVWDKVYKGRGYGFRRQYEMILVLEKGKPRYRNPGLSNIIKAKRIAFQELLHPHMKPLELIKTLILQSSDESDVVLDPFIGTGTTAVAAHQLERNFIGIELDFKYWLAAQRRLKREGMEAMAN